MNLLSNFDSNLEKFPGRPESWDLRLSEVPKDWELRPMISLKIPFKTLVHTQKYKLKAQ